jgi:CheY-like chemotaxis protein
MEHTEYTSIQTTSEATESQCRLNESEIERDRLANKIEKTLVDERNLMRTATKNLPEFDVQIAQQHPLRILLAEDSMVNMKIALWFLKKLGYHADVAFNGNEVIDALNRRDYDVILMDAEMPEMDGRQATIAIRKNFPSKQQPHIIAMTANSGPGDREEYIAIGMDDYITKPLRMEEMIRALLASYKDSTIINSTPINSNIEQPILRVAC